MLKFRLKLSDKLSTPKQKYTINAWEEYTQSHRLAVYTSVAYISVHISLREEIGKGSNGKNEKGMISGMSTG